MFSRARNIENEVVWLATNSRLGSQRALSADAWQRSLRPLCENYRRTSKSENLSVNAFKFLCSVGINDSLQNEQDNWKSDQSGAFAKTFAWWKHVGLENTEKPRKQCLMSQYLVYEHTRLRKSTLRCSSAGRRRSQWVDRLSHIGLLQAGTASEACSLQILEGLKDYDALRRNTAQMHDSQLPDHVSREALPRVSDPK